MLILRLSHHWWSLPLVGEEEDDGCDGGALSAVQEWINKEWNDLSGIVLPSRIRCYPLYIEIGWVHGGLGGWTYGLHAPESRRVF